MQKRYQQLTIELMPPILRIPTELEIHSTAAGYHITTPLYMLIL